MASVSTVTLVFTRPFRGECGHYVASRRYRTVVVSSIAALLTLATGAVYFRRMEQSFADLV
jgi:hypothetical protein